MDPPSSTCAGQVPPHGPRSQRLHARMAFDDFGQTWVSATESRRRRASGPGGRSSEWCSTEEMPADGVVQPARTSSLSQYCRRCHSFLKDVLSPIIAFTRGMRQSPSAPWRRRLRRHWQHLRLAAGGSSASGSEDGDGAARVGIAGCIGSLGSVGSKQISLSTDTPALSVVEMDCAADHTSPPRRPLTKSRPFWEIEQERKQRKRDAARAAPGGGLAQTATEAGSGGAFSKDPEATSTQGGDSVDPLLCA